MRLAQPAPERLALDVLHREECLTVMLVDLEHLHDVRMVEERQRARLSLQALAQRPRVGVRTHALERDATAEVVVDCEINLAHATGTDPPFEPITTEADRFCRAEQARANARNRHLLRQPLLRPGGVDDRRRALVRRPFVWLGFGHVGCGVHGKQSSRCACEQRDRIAGRGRHSLVAAVLQLSKLAHVDTSGSSTT
jgi:hypothetical protein